MSKLYRSSYSQFGDGERVIGAKNTKLALDSGDDEYGNVIGASVEIHQPSAWAHTEAHPDDPGALFSYDRPVIDNLWSHEETKPNVAALLAAAHETAVKEYGAVPTHAEELSPFSAPMVKHAIRKGQIMPREDGSIIPENSDIPTHSRALYRRVWEDTGKQHTQSVVGRFRTSEASGEVPFSGTHSSGQERVDNKIDNEALERGRAAIMRRPDHTTSTPAQFTGVQEEFKYEY